MSAPPARTGAAALLLAALLLLTGCQATVGVDAAVGRDGTGTVVATATLDKAAVARAGDLHMRAGDLAPTGWTVRERDRADGGRVVTATRPFRGGTDFGRAMGELGPPFAGFTLDRSRSFFRTRTAVSGAIDLRKGIEAFGDDRLAGQLGPGLGLQPDDQTALRQALRFQLAVRVPGASKSWTPRLGTRTPVAVSATAWNTDVLFPAVGAIFLLLGLAVLMLWRRYN
ncbi:MAG TPA: hypothetical protein VFA83_16820 [Acidimicrobiales bacterium]|nr:hypothetical protein [Acidimicrobiales bacterium]